MNITLRLFGIRCFNPDKEYRIEIIAVVIPNKKLITSLIYLKYNFYSKEFDFDLCFSNVGIYLLSKILKLFEVTDYDET